MGVGAVHHLLYQGKKGKNEVSFSQAKQFIAQKLVEESKDKILEEHFEKLRVKSRIVMIRE